MTQSLKNVSQKYKVRQFEYYQVPNETFKYAIWTITKFLTSKLPN